MTDIDTITSIEKFTGERISIFSEKSFSDENGYSINNKRRVTRISINPNNSKRTNTSFVTYLQRLTELRELRLSNCPLEDISFLKKLRKLQKFELINSNVQDISPLIDLPNLVELSLIHNDITDIIPIINLLKLRKLNLASNKISDITPIGALISLEELDLSSNKIIDVSVLRKLRKLRILNLNSNKIESMSSLADLKYIEELQIESNKIIDILPIRNMKLLRLLNLKKNPINELQPWIAELNLEIHVNSTVERGYISFENNPIKIPPIEIVYKGRKAISNFYKQLLEQKEDYLFEAKLLIVGEPGAGKTTMARKIENPECSLPLEKETTKGIEVLQYYFPMEKDNISTSIKIDERTFRLNIWDFGGQEIYKATHRFFLSKRSVYALVADSRNEDTDFNYWLNIVEMFGGESPLLIVLNEKHQRKRNIDTTSMSRRFTNISEVIDVDFAESDKNRINRLRRAVRYFSLRLPHVGNPVPSRWTDIREAIENNPNNTITIQEYLSICAINGISLSQDAMVLSQYFHDIGVFLHFQEDSLLSKTIFLKPNWATNAVYKLLDHELLNMNNGRFSREDTRAIWNEVQYEFLRDELLRLMQKFFLTYEINNSGEYIVPERLPIAQPHYSWVSSNNLFLRYQYDDFMPKGILAQLIVKMNQYIHNHNLVWRKGVIFERENGIAEVIEYYDSRTIKIRISGINKRDFMTIIMDQLDQINRQYEKLKVEKLIPCNCKSCKTDNEPYFYRYTDLKRRLENSRFKIECNKSFEMVNVQSMLDEIYFPIENSFNDESSTIDKELKDGGERNTIFICYSHKDKSWLEKVKLNISVLENLGYSVNIWDDTRIHPGMKWKSELQHSLSIAKVAILLVSTDFMVSEFISNYELPQLLKNAENAGAIILPIIIKPCLFSKNEALNKFQTVNDPKLPLSKMSECDQDDILVSLAERIAEIIKTR